MPRDASGNYTLPAGNPVAGGTTIETTWANPTMSDLGAEIQDSLSRSGKGGMLVAFQNVDGSVSAPGITWTLETGTGLYRAANNDMRTTVGGQDRMRWTATGSQVWNGTAWSDILTALLGDGKYALLSHFLNSGDTAQMLHAGVPKILSAASGGSIAGQLTIQDAAPVATNHATRKDYVDTADLLRVLKAGDTMTGQLKGITPVADEDLTRKDYVDSKDTSTAQNAAAYTDAQVAPKADTTYVDTQDGLRVLKAGDTMTGQLKGVSPVANEDLARKDYVDGQVSGVAQAVTGGYQIGSMLVQTGRDSTLSIGNNAQSFGTSFSGTPIVVATIEMDSQVSVAWGYNSVTTTGFNFYTNVQSAGTGIDGCSWHAIGPA